MVAAGTGFPDHAAVAAANKGWRLRRRWNVLRDAHGRIAELVSGSQADLQVMNRLVEVIARAGQDAQDVVRLGDVALIARRLCNGQRSVRQRGCTVGLSFPVGHQAPVGVNAG